MVPSVDMWHMSRVHKRVLKLVNFEVQKVQKPEFFNFKLNWSWSRDGMGLICHIPHLCGIFLTNALGLGSCEQSCKVSVMTYLASSIYIEWSAFKTNFKGKFSKARKQINLPTISDVKEDTAQEGQGAIKYSSIWEFIKLKLIFAFIFSVKSFFAASKFKKRRNKDENNKKHVALQSFYSWFEDSQALDRILNMVKNRKLNDEALITEIIYLTKRVKNI